jgi:beta-glucosidase
LRRGESRELSFRLAPEDLSLINEKGIAYQPKGKTIVSIGGGQPGIDNQATSNVVSKTVLVR